MSSGQLSKLPKDAAVMAALLAEAGVSQYDPRVIDQLLEFSHKYVTNVLDDARIYCNHAKKKNIDLDDIKIAIELQLEQNYTTPPSRELLAEIVQGRNSQPLPVVKPQCGVRLPPDRYCLTAINYKMESNKPHLTSNRLVSGSSFPGNSASGGGTKVAVVPHKSSQWSSPASGAGTQHSFSRDASNVQITMPKFKVQADQASMYGSSSALPQPGISASSGTITGCIAPLKRKLNTD